MVEEAPAHGVFAILTLSATRQFVRERHGRMMAVFFGLVFALVSMLIGQMLILTPLHVTPYAGILWTPGTNPQWWNYPGILIVGNAGVLDLPFLPTWTMVIVSVGVGLGASAAVLLAVEVIRMRRSAAGRSSAIGSTVGLTPAMIALVTLGTCCSTGAAAAAGIGAVAQTTGSTTYTLVTNNWYLDLFQVAVMGIALIAQEQLLFATRGLYTRPEGPRAMEATSPPAPLGRRFAVGSLLRVALLVGGVTWSLTMFAAWIVYPPQSASAALWISWIVQYQIPAVLAVLAALFPSAVRRALTSPHRSGTLAFRGVLVIAGLSLVTWVPPPISSWGIYGIGNELLGTLGVGAGWGAVVPTDAGPWSLALSWGLQYLLLGGFALAVALMPGRALEPIDWTVGRLVAPRPESPTALETRAAATPSLPLRANSFPGPESPISASPPFGRRAGDPSEEGA